MTVDQPPPQGIAVTPREILEGLAQVAIPADIHMGSITVWRREDGTPGIGDASPLISVSLALFAEQADPRFLFVEDGLVVFRGFDRLGAPRQVVYRAIGFQPAAAGHEPAQEGGFVLLERVR